MNKDSKLLSEAYTSKVSKQDSYSWSIVYDLEKAVNDLRGSKTFRPGAELSEKAQQTLTKALDLILSASKDYEKTWFDILDKKIADSYNS